MVILKQVEIGIEEIKPDGPTGRFLEVVEAAVEDHGGNEVGRATTAADVIHYRRAYDHRPIRLRAIKTVGEPSADLRPKVLCNY